MKGIDVLGEIVRIVNCPNIKSFGGWSLLFISIFLASIFIVGIGKRSSLNCAAFVLSILAFTLSIVYFNISGKEQCTHYLIHLTDEASYNEFNATYEIVDEICDGYYEVKLKDFKGNIND